MSTKTPHVSSEIRVVFMAHLDMYIKREKRLARFLAFVDRRNGVMHNVD